MYSNAGGSWQDGGGCGDSCGSVCTVRWYPNFQWGCTQGRVGSVTSGHINGIIEDDHLQFA